MFSRLRSLIRALVGRTRFEREMSEELQVHIDAFRLALGARRSEVLGRVLRETLGLAAAGIAIGLVAAMAATKLVSTFLYGLAPTDPATFAIAAIVLLATSLAAGFFPARRAAIVSPAQALKHE
jgi:putative ABC transport system permease protein